MRALTTLALVAFIAATFVYIARGGPRPELVVAADLSPAAALDAAKQLAGFALPDAEAENAGGTSRFYQYEDASGRTHFVQSLADVPSSARSRAKPLDVDSSRLIRDDRATPAGARPAQRVRAGAGSRFASNRDVVVYTTSWCGWCRKTVAWLDAKGVDYENRDIESDDAWRDELIEKTGSTSIPVVEIDGEIVRGFNPSGMTRLLGS